MHSYAHHEHHAHSHQAHASGFNRRLQPLLVLFVGFIAPFVVLLLSGGAEESVRAAYALCLEVIMGWGGAWIAFHAGPEELAKRWTPQSFKSAWTVFMRISGMFLIVAAAYLFTRTSQDVVEFLSAGRAKTFVEEARGVESRLFLHPFFQTVRLRGDRRYRTAYMFAYGGKRLVEGRRYVFAVLPRSSWILSATEEGPLGQ